MSREVLYLKTNFNVITGRTGVMCLKVGRCHAKLSIDFFEVKKYIRAREKKCIRKPSYERGRFGKRELEVSS